MQVWNILCFHNSKGNMECVKNFKKFMEYMEIEIVDIAENTRDFSHACFWLCS